MLKRILLPTDGSELSERAFAFGESLARAHGAELVLVRVVETPVWLSVDGYDYDYATPDVYQDVMDALSEDARAGLADLAARFEGKDITTQTSLLHGRASAELLDYEARERPDLVVMATHGRTGLVRFALGSVADRLVREGISPVLLVRSFNAQTHLAERTLVPLDGSAVAEQALPMLETLAEKPVHWVKLLRVVDAVAETDAALHYLDAVADRLASTHLEIATDVRVGTPASIIEAEAEAADLVILATHGRGGFDRFRHGSVAERATRHLATPVLLVRAYGSAQVETSLRPTEAAHAL